MKRIASGHKITEMIIETLDEVLKEKNVISLYNRTVNREELMRSVEMLS